MNCVDQNELKQILKASYEKERSKRKSAVFLELSDLKKMKIIR